MLSGRSALSTTRRLFGAAGTLKQTPLHDAHVAVGAKMVEFAGYSMPVQYKEGLLREHHLVRSKAGIFDVSHMGPCRVVGKDRIKLMEKAVVADVSAMKEWTGGLSLITNDKGGIIDDCIVSKLPDHLYVVLNAGCKEKDLTHLNDVLADSGLDAAVEPMEETALIALQGPEAMASLSQLTSLDLSQIGFMTLFETKLGGVDCLVSRSGYTGEDGFEIAVPSQHAAALWDKLQSMESVSTIGLGARDSLRLEAGLCLYGNDIDHTTTPNEAGLLWTISKRRRAEGGFLGWSQVKDQIENGVQRRRVGLLLSGAPPARAHSKISNGEGEVVGEITSGGPSPTLGSNIAMGYVAKPFAKAGTNLKVQVRNRQVEAVVTKMPFVKSNYFKL